MTISNDLDIIQNFIDDTFTSENVSMTAASIIALLKDRFETDLTDEEYLDIFRAAVRCGRITDLRSAKRAGYKMATEETEPHELADDMDVIQAFIDKNFIGSFKMSSPNILEAIKGSISVDLDKARFAILFRELILCGELVNIKSQGKGYVGSDVKVEPKKVKDRPKKADPIRRTVSKKVKPEPEVIFDEKEISGCVLQVTNKLRIYPIERGNWALQKLSTSTGEPIWVSKRYWCDLGSAINGVAKYLVTQKLHNTKINVKTLKEMSELAFKIEREVSKTIFESMKAKEALEVVGTSKEDVAA